MKILLAISTPVTYAAAIIHQQLTGFLSKWADRFGIYCNGPLSSPADHKIEYFHHINNIRESEWDVCIVQDARSFLQVQAACKKIPLLFIACGRQADHQCFVVPNLYKVIRVQETIKPADWGIPDEFISLIPVPMFFFPKKNKPRAKAIRLHAMECERDTTLQLHRLVIRAGNRFPHTSITVYCEAEYAKLLQPLANDHIRFVSYSNIPTTAFRRSDILITTGEMAAAGKEAGLIVIDLDKILSPPELPATRQFRING